MPQVGQTFILLLGVAALSSGQITTVGNDTATPIAGAGHDYRQMLSEIVSPVNGSLSIRISVPVPKGRGLTIPFSFDYDSAGVNHLYVSATGEGLWLSGSGYLNSGGWTYGIPLLTSVPLRYQGGEGKTGNPLYCNGQHDFVFANSAGERHALTSLNWVPPSVFCTSSGSGFGDDRYLAQISDATKGLIEIADHDGTVFSFNLASAHEVSAAGAAETSLPSSIEDRNGNVVSVADPGSGAFTFTDSAGRAAISSSGFAAAAGAQTSVTVSGLSPYKVTWGTATASYSVSAATVLGNDCIGIDTVSSTQPVITAITLPNGQSYQFEYLDPYGLVSKVTYPNGAYSLYNWGLNASAEQAVWEGQGANGPLYCTYNYGEPAVQSRLVSFDGTNVVLEEDYQYNPTTWSSTVSPGNSGGWTGKATKVTSTVSALSGGSLKAAGSFVTTYNYTSYTLPRNEYDVSESNASVANQVPLETSIVYGYASGNPLRTVAKIWKDQFLLQSETTTLDDSSTSQTAYTYKNGELATEMEYGYGSGSRGGLIKAITINYQPFSATPIFPTYLSILDRPCQIITYDSTQTNRVAEADYFYDGGMAVCGTAGTPSVTEVSSLSGHDDINYGSSSASARGNLTQISNQILQSSTAAVSTFTYDETGQVTSAKDPDGHTTLYSHADSFGSGGPAAQTNAYLTQITQPGTLSASGASVSHVRNFRYQYADGQLASSSDQNSQITSYLYNDSLGRLTETDFPDGGKTTLVYTDSGSNSPYVTRSSSVNSASTLTTRTLMDGAGHPIQTQITSDPAGTVKTDTSYDGLGRVVTKSNPYRGTSDATNVTTYSYDALGRTVSVTTPDGAVAQTSYAGSTTTITDQAKNARSLTADALGRLVAVTEDPTTGGLNYATSYAYDALDNLIGVSQSGMTRTFAYDSLKRLLAASNPENATPTAVAGQTCAGATGSKWTTCYSYDNAGNLLTKTDNRQTTVSNSYDALNRVLNKTYSDGTPGVSYAYDSGTNSSTNVIGHLTSVTNNNSVTQYTAFDPMGRVTASTQNTGGQSYGFSYSYNLLGSLWTETYPSGRVLTTTFDAANHATGLSGALSSASTGYVSQASYAPHGALASAVYGNNVTPAYSYNSRLQVNEIAAMIGNSTSQYLMDLTYNWGGANNNGNLQGSSEGYGAGVPLASLASLNQSYTYDAVNRLTGVTDTGYARTFGYDAYGNMWVKPGATGIAPAGNTPTANVFNGNNQIGGLSYDAAGNQLTVNGSTAAYDAENRQTSVTEPASLGGAVERYLYDGNGQRVQKSGPDGVTVSVYDALGRVAAEYATAGAASACTTCYLVADHLGTPRLVTDQSAKVVARHDYLPFGEEIAAGAGGRGAQWGPGNDAISHKFTGKERDAESGLDYFGARYYGSALGRFTSPDPLGNMAATVADPQSWNQYTYGRNNPLLYTDPDGFEYQICDANGNCSKQQISDEEFANEKKSAVANGEVFSHGELSHTDADGNRVVDGTYTHTSEDMDSNAAATLSLAGRMAAPGVNLAYQGLRLFGYIVAAPVMAAAECAAGPCDKANLAMAAIPGGEEAEIAETAVAASEKQALRFAKQIAKDLGKDARREFHDLKEAGAGDRSLQQLKNDALDLYREHGMEPPAWMK